MKLACWSESRTPLDLCPVPTPTVFLGTPWSPSSKVTLCVSRVTINSLGKKLRNLALFFFPRYSFKRSEVTEVQHPCLPKVHLEGLTLSFELGFCSCTMYKLKEDGWLLERPFLTGHFTAECQCSSKTKGVTLVICWGIGTGESKLLSV